MHYEAVSIPGADHLPLAGRVYGQLKAKPAPVVVLCHGFCGIQDILLPAYAQAFAEVGYLAVTFDYRGFGASGGERGRLVPQQQVLDVLTVIDWVKAQSWADAERVALWGTSLGACHAVVVASRLPSLKCLLLQMPFANGETLITGRLPEAERAPFLETLEKMQARRTSTGKDLFVPIPKVMSDPQSRAFFERCKASHPEMDVKIPFLTVWEMAHYKPVDVAIRVVTPSLVVVAGDDEVNPPEQGLALYGRIRGRKAVQVIDKAGHYDLYQGRAFDTAVGFQLDWLAQYL
ncbi:pimeloyl-ACP methyl ester carboxylesterase [Pseudomonas alcaligenes]|nr:pimeloyl-ACP methyl ester carboxylesterase [Pseudomonas alcaligenes]